MTGPLETVSDLATSGMIVAFNFFSNHPTFSGGLTVLFGGSWGATQAIRGWWPESKRPRWARATLAVCAPFAGVVRGLLRRASGRATAGAAARTLHRAGHRPRRAGRAS